MQHVLSTYNMPGNPHSTCEAGLSPILQMWKQRLREENLPMVAYRVIGEHHFENPGLLTPELFLLPPQASGLAANEDSSSKTAGLELKHSRPLSTQG